MNRFESRQNELDYWTLIQRIFFILTLCLYMPSLVYSASGDLDSTFDGDGKVLTDVSGSDDGSAIAIQSDGKIVVAGDDSHNFVVVRYDSNGTPDSTFSGDGIVITDFDLGDDQANGIAIQPDDKIVVVGYADLDLNRDFALARYNSDGSLDNSFGLTGRVTTEFGSPDDQALDVQIDNQGRIVVVGKTCQTATTCDFALARYNSNGNLDPTFGNGGKVITDFLGGGDVANALAIQPDGRILAAGWMTDPTWHMAIARYQPDGTLDPTFGIAGTVMTDFGPGYEQAYDIGLLADGRIVIAGLSNENAGDPTDFTVVRYLSDGTLDLNFGTNGFVTTDFFSNDDIVFGLVVREDDKIIVAGYSRIDQTDVDFAVAQYTQNGLLDTTFGTGGKVTTDFGGGFADVGADVALQRDGKIVVVGSAHFDIALARYEGDPLSVCEYLDNFEDGILNPSWTYRKPSWSESGGDLIGIPDGRTAEATALPGYGGCDTCDIGTRMMTMGGPGNKVFLLAWYRDKSNTVELIMKEESNRWILRQRVGGKIVVKEKVISPIDPGVFYNVGLAFGGSSFALTINSEILLIMPTGFPPFGSIGYRVKNTTGRFDIISSCLLDE